MDIAEMEAFIAVAESKSVQNGAARLNLSQSAVTRRLQNLEHSLNAVLIHRDARPLTLTPEGAEAYKHAKNVLSAIDAMREAMTPNAEMKGEFRLGISMSLGDTVLTGPIGILRREFPNLQLNAVVDESQSLMRSVERRELDAVVIFLIEDARVPEGLSGELLNRKPFGVVAAKSLPIPSPVSLAELSDYPWVLNPPGCTARDELMRAYRTLGKPIRVVMESPSLELKFSLIESGLGIGLARLSNFAASKYAGQLHVIVPTDFQRQVGMWLVHSPNIGRLKAPLACLSNALRLPTDKA